MKFAVTVLLLAICASCITAQYETRWGDVTNTRILAEQKVTVSSGWLQIRERSVTYRSHGGVIVRGILHLDYKTKSRVTPTIVQGGLGQTFAAVRIVTQRGHGINSKVIFYG